MTERPHELGDIKGVGHFEAKFRLKGYASHQYLWTAKWGNGCVTTLPLDVFTQRNFVADFIRLKLNLIFFTNKTSLLRHPLGNLGSTYAVHL